MIKEQLTKEDYLKLLLRKRFRKYLLNNMKANQQSKKKRHLNFNPELRAALKEYHQNERSSIGRPVTGSRNQVEQTDKSDDQSDRLQKVTRRG